MASGSTISSHDAPRGRALESYRFAAVLRGPHGAFLLESARAILDAAALGGRYDILGAAGDESERALVLDADVTILAGDSLSRVAPSARERARPPGGPGGGEDALAWLLAPLDVAIRFQPCRAYPGNPWGRREGVDIIVLGDGGLGAPTRQSREDLMSAAWGYAERQGARRVTLLYDRSVGAAEREALEAVGGAHAARYAETVFVATEHDPANDAGFDRLADAVRGAHVIVAAGDGSDAVFARAAALAGGEAFVPAARFGEAVAVVEIAGAPAGGRAGAPAVTPVVSALAAKTICDWVGEAGKGARIERAVAEAIREGALARLAAEAARDDAALHAITEAIVRRI